MLDLKSKLAAAGLVTQKDVDRVDQAKRDAKNKKNNRNRGGKGRGPKPKGAKGEAKLRVAELRDQRKGEQYDAIRRFVERVRLVDAARPPTENAQTFHFPTALGQVGRLSVEPEVHGQIRDGSAAIVAFMSNHGLAHTAVPAAAARQVAELFPLWLRVLKDDPRAGQLAPPPEPAPTAAGPSESSSEAVAGDAASVAADQGAAPSAPAADTTASE